MSKTHFTIVVPAFNCARWVERNLSSAINQEYDNYHLVYIDDASTDNTATIARKILDAASCSYELVENKANCKALENIFTAVESSRKGTVIVALDGDDWLLNNTVLSALDGIYRNDKTWITSGSYIDNALGRIHRPNITSDFWQGNIRKKKWKLSHLRTFRRELFMKIEKKDLLDLDGKFYKYTWDRAIMYPMVEMSGQERFAEISTPLYVYNAVNPFSVHRTHRSEQLRIEQLLIRKTPYLRLEEL